MKWNKRQKTLAFWSGGLVVTLLLCCGCFITSTVLKRQAYSEFISISAATASGEKIAVYHRAIRLCPDRPEAYLLLLDTIGEDGLFDQSESELFLSIYNANHKFLPKTIDSAAIYAKAGLLYVNGMDGTSTQALRMALPFFEAALPLLTADHPEYSATACYVKIGQYYRDFIWTTSVKEVFSADMTVLLTDITQTLENFAEDKGAEKAFNYLGFANAVCNLLYGQRDVFAATVNKQDVLSVMDLIYDGMPNVDTLQVARTRDMANTLCANREMYYDMISRAFDRTGGD
jgi:hypothetical protein